MTEDLFESAKLLIKNVPKELDKLEVACQVFLDRCERKVITKFDPNTGEKIVKIKAFDTPVPDLRIKAYRLVNDLRNALDQATYAASISIGSASIRHVSFPFGENLSQITRALTSTKGNFRGIPAALHSYLLALKPYEGGNALLFSLGKISNPNKHQVMLKVGVNVKGLGFRTISGNFRIDKMRWNFAKTEFELFRIPPNSQANFNFNVPILIEFSNGSGIGGKPIIATLNEMSGMVEGIVFGLEAETGRILRG